MMHLCVNRAVPAGIGLLSKSLLFDAPSERLSAQMGRWAVVKNSALTTKLFILGAAACALTHLALKIDTLYQRIVIRGIILGAYNALFAAFAQRCNPFLEPKPCTFYNLLCMRSDDEARIYGDQILRLELSALAFSISLFAPNLFLAYGLFHTINVSLQLAAVRIFSLDMNGYSRLLQKHNAIWNRIPRAMQQIMRLAIGPD